MVDTYLFHPAIGHAESMNFELSGTLRECEGRILVKGIRVLIAKHASNRSDQMLGRIFVDLTGEKEYAAFGGKRYAIMFRDDYS